MAGARVIRRDDVALVVVDIQERLAAAMERREEVVAVTARLMRVAGLLGWPVILTRQYPQGLGDLEPPLLALADSADLADVPVRFVDKTAFCCLAEPAFATALSETGRRQVLLAGMETHICVTQTALALLAEGTEPFVAADACCSRRERDNDLALERLRAEGVVVTTSESAMYEACGVAGTDEFRALLRLVKGT
jgi:nicotinamidase-related amidase